MLTKLPSSIVERLPLRVSSTFMSRLRRPLGKQKQIIPGGPEEVTLISSSGLFDEHWYFDHYSIPEEPGTDAVQFYVKAGARLGQKPHPLFDPDHYRQANPEFAASGLTPLAHYILYGAADGIAPHPLFDPSFYKQQRGEALPADANPLYDFVTQGFRAGSMPHPLFDVTYYLEQPSGLTGLDVNPLTHFVDIGAAKGLCPNRWFDTSWYVSAYSDLLRPGENPLAHFIMHGAAEQLYPHPRADLARYRELPGVPKGWISAYIHLVQSGSTPADTLSLSVPAIASRSRTLDIINPYFEVTWYGQQARTSFSSGMAAAEHYMDEGWKLNLAPNYLFDPIFYAQGAATGGHEVPLYDYVVRGSRHDVDPHPLLNLSSYRTEASLPYEGDEPLLHYLTHGARRGLKPNPLFDPSFITWRYGRTWAETEHMLAQYVTDPTKALAATHPLFLGSHYWSMSRPTFNSRTPALSHFLRGGWQNGTSPHPLFDPAFYLSINPDVRTGGWNPLLHYVHHGGSEFRDPSPLFSVSESREATSEQFVGAANPVDRLFDFR